MRVPCGEEVNEASSETSACIALHEYGESYIVWQPLQSSISHSIDRASISRSHHRHLLRPHSSMHDGVWLNPCGLTVSCQTCTLAGSTGPPGPSLTRRVCHRKKKEREKREADSSPAGLQAAPLLARGPGQRGQGQKAEGGAIGTTGVALGEQGRQKTLHSPGSLHSCPNQKLHLSICSNLNGPGQGPLLTVSPRRRCQQPIRRCDSSRSLDVLGRSSTLHCLSSRDCETASLPRQRQNGARRAVGAVIGNLDSPSPSRKRIPRLGTDLQNRASFHGNVKIARAHAPPSLHPPRSAHASWPCWPRTASRAPSCAFASSVCLQSPPGWFVQGCRLFFFSFEN